MTSRLSIRTLLPGILLVVAALAPGPLLLSQDNGLPPADGAEVQPAETQPAETQPAEVQPADSGEADPLQQRFDELVVSLADDVSRYLDSESGVSGVHLSGFSGPGAGGPRIARALRQQLEERGVNLVDEAGSSVWTVAGRFEQGRVGNRFVTAVSAQIFNPQGNPMETIPRRLTTDRQFAIETFGATVDLTLAATPEEERPTLPEGATVETTAIADEQVVDERLAGGIAEPQVAIDGTIARLSEGSPYGIELLVRRPEGLVPLPVEVEDGFARARLTAEDVYAIRVVNDTDRPIGVAVTVDGINIFAFSDDPRWRELGKLIVRPPVGTIRGWHASGDVAHEFRITNYGESAAGEFGQLEGVGVITATYFEVEGAKAIPPDIAFGRGEEVGGAFDRVQMRISDRLLGAASIHYTREIVPIDLPD